CARRTIGRLDRLSNAAETARVERARRELNRCRRRDAAPCEAAANRFLVFVAERAIGFEDLTDDFRVREEVRIDALPRAREQVAEVVAGFEEQLFECCFVIAIRGVEL